MVENEARELKESIELTRFLTREQIEDILDLAIKTGPKGKYEAKVEIQLLKDELMKRGLDVPDEFRVGGSSWKCPKCNRQLTGVARCPCGHEDETVVPKGTYEFLFERDLGQVGNYCENHGCNHPIRFEEHIRHKESGRILVVGNVCVQRILGEHDLVKVATSLLSRCSSRVDRLNKARRCDEICGDALRRVVKIDPKHYFTKEEADFLGAIENARGTITLKKAREMAEKWDEDARSSPFSRLVSKVKAREKDIQNEREETRSDRSDERSEWLDFLKFMKKRRGNGTDFWDNCIEVTKRDDRPTPGQRRAVGEEFRAYKAVRKGDRSVLDSLDPITRSMGRAMFDHQERCHSRYHLGLLIQLIVKAGLTERQIATLREGCKRCGWKFEGGMSEEDACSIAEEMGREAHRIWMRRRKEMGQHAPSDCPDLKRPSAPHPCPKCHEGMVRYDRLPEAEREMDRAYAEAFLDVLFNRGFEIVKKEE
ncbi:MAG: hypothetical protein GF414_08580 [Candidatus Altiarchaeales archaeon]|nr:hypothetical protein [Candidatus Altiarchaeales archaeon]